jgi:hypothetical protein
VGSIVNSTRPAWLKFSLSLRLTVSLPAAGLSASAQLDGLRIMIVACCMILVRGPDILPSGRVR